MTTPVALLLSLMMLIGTGPSLAEEATHQTALPEKCWLTQEVSRGGFTIKVFLTDKHPETVETENLLIRYPHGQPDLQVGLSEGTRRSLFYNGPYPMYLEIWHGKRLLYVLNEFGAFENFTGFEKSLMRQTNFPLNDFISYSLFFNTNGQKKLSGKNIMFNISPREERLVAFDTNCSQDILFERVSGGLADDEFDRVQLSADGVPARHVCDAALDNYGPLGVGGLPRPVRRIVFDSKENQWRVDRLGEFPMFYWAQIPISLSYSGVELSSSGPARNSKADAEKSGRALMAELRENKSDFFKKTNLDLAFITYSLLMMGLSPEEVREFFLEMTAEYTAVKGIFDWGQPPEEAFNDIKASANNFSPIERQEVFTYRGK